MEFAAHIEPGEARLQPAERLAEEEEVDWVVVQSGVGGLLDGEVFDADQVSFERMAAVGGCARVELGGGGGGEGRGGGVPDRLCSSPLPPRSTRATNGSFRYPPLSPVAT